VMIISKAVIRCWLLLFLGAVCRPLLAQPPTTHDLERSCRAFVQRFYEWYVPYAVNESTACAWCRVLRYRPADVSPKLRRALRTDSEAQAEAAGGIVGLDFDPFLNTQDPNKRYVIGRVAERNGRCWAPVYGASPGRKSAKPDVTAELVLKGRRWLFANFHYGKSKNTEDEDLIDLLTHLQAYRHQHPK
jgi:hypothetical protein